MRHAYSMRATKSKSNKARLKRLEEMCRTAPDRAAFVEAYRMWYEEKNGVARIIPEASEAVEDEVYSISDLCVSDFDVNALPKAQ